MSLLFVSSSLFADGSLNIQGNTANKATITLPAILTDLARFTIIVSIYIPNGASTVNNRLYQKGVVATDSTTSGLLFSGASGFDLNFGRVSQATEVIAPFSSFVNYKTNDWIWIASVIDAPSNSTTVNHLYVANSTSTFAEATSYLTNTGGSGAHNTDVGADATVGNKANNGNNFEGVMGTLTIASGCWTISQLNEMKNDLYSTALSTGILAEYHFGWNGTGNQIDFTRSGNNGVLSGVGGPVGLNISPPLNLSGGMLQ